MDQKCFANFLKRFKLNEPEIFKNCLNFVQNCKNLTRGPKNASTGQFSLACKSIKFTKQRKEKEKPQRFFIAFGMKVAKRSCSFFRYLFHLKKKFKM